MEKKICYKMLDLECSAIKCQIWNDQLYNARYEMIGY